MPTAAAIRANARLRRDRCTVLAIRDANIAPSTVACVRPMTGELDYSDDAVAERVRRSNARVFAIYLVAQAVVGLAFWVGLAVSEDVRKLFELVPEVRSVTSTWLFADLVVGVLGSSGHIRVTESGFPVLDAVVADLAA